jgi:hypothetical protein
MISKQTIMKTQNTAKKSPSPETELENVKKKLKKRELETNILKKIIGEAGALHNTSKKQ